LKLNKLVSAGRQRAQTPNFGCWMKNWRREWDSNPR